MSDRITQNLVDQAADQILKDVGYDIEKVIPNQVAVRLGKSKANGGIGDAVANWKERRIAEGVPFVTKAPPELDAALDEACEDVRRAVRGIVGRFCADESEARELDTGKWSDRYDALEARHKALEDQLIAERAAGAQLEEAHKKLQGEVARLNGELVVTSARLDEAQKMRDQLLDKIRPESASTNVSASLPDKEATIDKQQSASGPASAKSIEPDELDMSRFDYKEDGEINR